MDYASQAAIDLAFADLDSLLAKPEPVCARQCASCGGTRFDRGANPGQVEGYYDVCTTCGVIVNSTFGCNDAWSHGVPHSCSNYKRIHHWHERISQLLLQESRIPNAHFMQIAERLLDGTYTAINKDVIRQVLRSLNMQMYIEKWLQIIQRCTGLEPPKPGSQLLTMLDNKFIELQRPFACGKDDGRKNFLNYNYVFCRLFQQLDCTQFCMFFPLIKSKQKLKMLDAMWERMASSVGWEVTPLQFVQPFAVKLEQPALLLLRIRQQGELEVQAEMHTEPLKKGFRKSDQFLLHELERQKKRALRRSCRPEPAPRRPAMPKKRSQSAGVVKLQRLLQSKHLRQLG